VPRPQFNADASIARAKHQLSVTAKRLSLYLTGSGSNGVAWKTYLKWSELQAQLQEGAEMDLKQLRGIYRLYTANHVGLG